jgi:hypothetical protein
VATAESPTPVLPRLGPPPAEPPPAEPPRAEPPSAGPDADDWDADDWDADEPDELIPLYADEPRAPRARPATRRRVIVASCTVAALAIGSTGGYLLTHRSAHHSAKPKPTASHPPGQSNVRQAEAWIRANLPKSARVGSDAAVTADLLASGYSAAGLYTSIDRQGAGSFLVTTPNIRDSVVRDTTAAAQRIAPLRVAAFGGGQIAVVLLVGSSATSLSDRIAQDDGERRAADASLLDNPHVLIDPASRHWLADGQLDLRAAATVALLAARTDVRLTRVIADPGEQAAGRPARTVALSLHNPGIVDAVLRALPGAYAPVYTAVLSTGERQLTWAVGLAPAGL